MSPLRLSLLCLLLTPPNASVAAVGPEWQQMPPEKFRQLPEVNAQIDFANYDRRLMAAAIFHETNRVRVLMGREKFQYLPKLDEAADLQAGTGAMLASDISHHNPFSPLATIKDRVHAVGLDFQLVAENIALTMALDGDQTGTGVGVREVGQQSEFFDPRTGRRLEPLTYAAFAKVVVEQWMKSPGHRANILNRELRCLGCSARWHKDYFGVDQLYSVQVFFTPEPGS
jgi:uncharacterized protein YkwD